MVQPDSKTAIEKVNKSMANYLAASQQLVKDLDAATLNKTDKETLINAMNTMYQASTITNKVYPSILKYLAIRLKQVGSGIKSGSRKKK